LFGQYRFDSWTTDNGLPQNGVREITQTPDGYLWFTTFDGLVRFDGVKFTTFNKGNTKGIINNRFTGVYCDKDGTLYATTMEDGVLTIYRNGTFTSYTSKQVPERYIDIFREDENGELKFKVDTGDHLTETWYSLKDGKFVFKEKLENKNIKIKTDGKTGKVWTISKNETIESQNGNTTVYPHEIKIFDSSINYLEDSTGGLWLGGTSLTYLKDGKKQQFGEKEGFPHNSDFHSFWEESDGSFWFANGGRTSPGLGLVRYKDGQFSVFGKDLGLTDTNIQHIFRDRENNVWLGTGKGLNRLKKSVITTQSIEHGLSDSEVYPIYKDSKNNIWVGTAKGLNIYRDGKFEPVNFKQSGKVYSEVAIWKNNAMSIQSLFEDSNGKMWIGVAGGIFIAENGKAEMLKVSEGYHVHCILEDQKGNVWAATNKGILRFNNYKLTKSYSIEDGLRNEFLSLIFEDSHGDLWFGGFGGLSKFKDEKFINYTKEDGLAGNYVRSIYEDNEGTFWIGTYDEGLSRFKEGHFVNYRIEDGLFNNGVFAIQEDHRGYFWISSNGGIYRVKRQELNDFADGKVSQLNSIGYGKQDGMLNNECNGGRQPASLKDEDGKFWFPTQDGVAIVDPKVESYNPLPPSVVIESATVEREKVKINNNNLIIEPGQKNIEIKFTGISLIKSEQIKFKYRLEGHDPDWIDADDNRTAYYSYLPHGNYVFRVKAANSDGIWNEEGATLNLELKPFFYQTTWFYLLCIGVGFFALFVVWKISVYQFEARERRLAKLVDEKTEELKIANLELQHLVNSDGLTAIGNRRRFEEFLAEEWKRARRSNTEISMILIDIDHFKLFNDTYGHLEGDESLKKVAEALKNTVNRPTDLVARFGGEEFAIIMGGTDAEGALIIAKEAFENVNNLQIPHKESETCGHLTISIGVATIFAKNDLTEAELIKAADDALYQAKENGRNQIVCSDLTQKSYRSSVLEKEYIKIS
jgi:diguanylate cyclase (GGDEF)-like protein